MTTQSSRRALQLRLWALFMFFFIPGLLMASWATRTPAIRDLLALSTAEMGVVLFGLSVGYSLLGVAGEALWYPQGHPHHHVLRRAWHAGAQPGAVGHFRPAVRLRSGYLRRQLRLRRGRY